MTSKPEELVRKMDKLKQESNRYEDWMRSLRLGRGVEMVSLRLRKGVYGFGWLSTEIVTEMPKGMEYEFYEFLQRKRSKADAKVNEIRKELEGD